MLIVIAAVLAAVVVLAIIAWLVLRRFMRLSLPRTEGRVALDGVGAPVAITRDRKGYVHVRAEHVDDAAFAMGFVHAQDRLWQLDLNRRVASGRISEIAGAEGIAADRFMRRVGLRRIAEAEVAQLDEDTAAMLAAYAAGINAVITSERALPLEFRLLRITPEPWTPVDSVACLKLLALGLSTNWDNEVQRLDLLRQVGPAAAATLDLVYPDANPTILASTVRATASAGDISVAELFREAARWVPSTGGGSNSWVVSGARTTTGRPMLCNDPHLPPSLPSVWYQAHIRVDNDFETTGVTFPGAPLPLIGHTDAVAWGFTNSFADCQDLVIEDFEDGSMARYRTESGAADATALREVIRVKGASAEVEDVIVTRHGPIVERITDVDGGLWRGLALQWTALQPGDVAGSLLRVQRARNGSEFRAAFSAFDAPSQNVVWADTAGHIGYFLCGRVPVRRGRASGLPVCGWDGASLWQRLLAPDETPAVVDPPEGFIVTANNRVVGDDFPHYIGADYMNGYRALRITELLHGTAKLDAATMNAIQLDVVAPPAREVSALLASITCDLPESERLRQLLVAWDGGMRPALVEPTLYALFMRALVAEALEPVCGDAWRTVAGTDRTHDLFGYPGNIVGRLTPVILQRWRDNDAAFIGDGRRWADVATSALDSVARDARRKKKWGALHAVPLEHRLAVNPVTRFLFRARSIRAGGDADSVMATSSIPSEESLLARLFAPSWRQIIDVGAWENCTGIHYPGQSGQPASPHYDDLSSQWLSNTQLPLVWGDAVETIPRARKLVLEPRAVSVRA